MTEIASRLAQTITRIRQAETRFHRRPGSVRLLAVSKTQPPRAIRQAYANGQAAFAENYLQEALGKIESLRDLPIEWHFIGPLQTNKTKAVAEHFDWVHSVDREKIARRLNDRRPPDLPALNVCLQVNISGESSKAGVEPNELPALAAAVGVMPRLRLRGLMGIPAPCDDIESQRKPLRRLRQLLNDLRAQGLDLDTLSMGMSADLEAAVAEGATMVRIGTAVFGPRQR